MTPNTVPYNPEPAADDAEYVRKSVLIDPAAPIDASQLTDILTFPPLAEAVMSDNIDQLGAGLGYLLLAKRLANALATHLLPPAGLVAPRFSRIMYADGQQYLLRLCHHPGLVGMPGQQASPDFRVLTIDTEQALPGGPPHMMRGCANCEQLPAGLFDERLLQAFTADDCRLVRYSFEGVATGVHNQQRATELMQELTERILERLHEAYPEEFPTPPTPPTA